MDLSVQPEPADPKNKAGLPCGGGRPLRTCRRFGLAEFCSVERSTGASDDIGWARSTRHSRVRIVSSGEVPKHSPSYRLIDSLDHLLTASATSAATMSAHRRRDIQPAGRHPRHSARSDLLTQPSRHAADQNKKPERSSLSTHSVPRVFRRGAGEAENETTIAKEFGPRKHWIHNFGSQFSPTSTEVRPFRACVPERPRSHPGSEVTSILRTL